MDTINQRLIDNNYIIVENFIAPELATDLYAQLIHAARYEQHRFTYSPQVPNSPKLYNFLPFVNILLDKCADVSSVYGRRVYPTYTCSRLYRKGAELHPHVDRPACEVSVTLHLGNDGKNWPFYIRTPDNKEAKVNFKPGTGVIYLGTKAEHWRKKLAGDNYGQVFLHYVDSEGPYTGCLFDRG